MKITIRSGHSDSQRHVDTRFSSKRRTQCDKLIKTAGTTGKFDGDANLYRTYYVETTAPKYVKQKSRQMPRKLKGSLKSKDGGVLPNACFTLGTFIQTGDDQGRLVIFILVF